MTYQEFLEKAKGAGLNGKPHINGRQPGGSNVTLTFVGTNNDMFTAGDFGDHEVGPVNVSQVARSEANASGFRGRAYQITDR